MESQREPRADCRQQLVGEKLIGVRRGQPGHVRANASQILITHYWGADPVPCLEPGGQTPGWGWVGRGTTIPKPLRFRRGCWMAKGMSMLLKNDDHLPFLPEYSR